MPHVPIPAAERVRDMRDNTAAAAICDKRKNLSVLPNYCFLAGIWSVYHHS